MTIACYLIIKMGCIVSDCVNSVRNASSYLPCEHNEKKCKKCGFKQKTCSEFSHCCKCGVETHKDYHHCCECRKNYSCSAHCCKCEDEIPNDMYHCCTCNRNYFKYLGHHCCVCHSHYPKNKPHCCICSEDKILFIKHDCYKFSKIYEESCITCGVYCPIGKFHCCNCYELLNSLDEKHSHGSTCGDRKYVDGILAQCKKRNYDDSSEIFFMPSQRAFGL